jgi:catechol 2,3-dioxygenase-like lactoylglutathione lyase family enzyme
MIFGSHVIIFADDAERARAFFRDVLGLASVDARDGWLIFKLPPAELGIHPAGRPDDPGAGQPEDASAAPAGGRHQLYLMCDDLAATVTELTAKGVEFTSPVENQGFGLITTLRVPGAGELSLYQPRHATALDLHG